MAINLLLHAVQTGDTEKVRYNLSRDNVEMRYTFGRTILMIAAFYDNPQIVELILDAGANIESIDINGCTALMNASSKGHVSIVTLLISRRADINKVDGDGNTCLMKAAEKGHVDVTTELLRTGANVHMENRYGDTALHRALGASKFPVGELLVLRGANLSSVNKFRQTPMNFIPTSMRDKFNALAGGTRNSRTRNQTWRGRLHHTFHFPPRRMPRASQPGPPSNWGQNSSAQSIHSNSLGSPQISPIRPNEAIDNLWRQALDSPISSEQFVEVLSRPGIISCLKDLVLAHNLVILAIRQGSLKLHNVPSLHSSRDFLLDYVYMPATKVVLSSHENVVLKIVVEHAERRGFIRQGHAALVRHLGEIRYDLHQDFRGMNNMLNGLARYMMNIDKRTSDMEFWTMDAAAAINRFADLSGLFANDMKLLGERMNELYDHLIQSHRLEKFAGIARTVLSLIPFLGDTIGNAAHSAANFFWGLNAEDLLRAGMDSANGLLSNYFTADLSNLKAVRQLVSEPVLERLNPLRKTCFETIVMHSKFRSLRNMRECLDGVKDDVDVFLIDDIFEGEPEEEQTIRMGFDYLLGNEQGETLCSYDAALGIFLALKRLTGNIEIDECFIERKLKNVWDSFGRVSFEGYWSVYLELKKEGLSSVACRRAPQEIRELFRTSARPHDFLSIYCAYNVLERLYSDCGPDGGANFCRSENEWNEDLIFGLLHRHGDDERLVKEEGFVHVAMIALFGSDTETGVDGQMERRQ